MRRLRSLLAPAVWIAYSSTGYGNECDLALKQAGINQLLRGAAAALPSTVDPSTINAIRALVRPSLTGGARFYVDFHYVVSVRSEAGKIEPTYEKELIYASPGVDTINKDSLGAPKGFGSFSMTAVSFPSMADVFNSDNLFEVAIVRCYMSSN